MKRFHAICLCSLLVLASRPVLAAGEENKTWTDPDVALREDPDFAIQGEYGSIKPGAEWGAQVVARGGGEFEAYVLKDGLPGLGWAREKARTLLKGKREGDGILLETTDKSVTATIRDGKFELKSGDGKTEALPHVERHSQTLDAPAPKGAVVLFDGKSADEWENGKMENGLLLATGSSTKRVFKDYKLHLEFRTPYKPFARGQKRGNSGVYQSGRWETQILDSFGLTGEENETGGIYSISKPRLNMCLPPLSWQTYDVDFTAARFDASGNRTAWPRITVKLNGELVHENLELNKDFTTSAPIHTPLTSPEGPIHLQYHDNPVVFRNIWIVPGE